jgi:intracellular sulfur oxidation DsrE/DsrF family protein
MISMRQLAATATLAAALVFSPLAALANGPKVAIHVDEDNPATMNMALNNAVNIISHYAAQGQTATVEIVTYGPGLTMLREGLSPVADRISDLSMSHETISFSACLNTVASIQQRTNADVPLLPEANVVPSGAVRLMELQFEGYAYLRP